MKKNEEKLLREYVGSILNEFDEFSSGTSGGAALRRAFSGAAKEFGSAMAGATKKVGAAVGKTLGMTYEALKEIGSFGFFKARYDEVEQRYKDRLNDISQKHGAALAAADDSFLSAFGPIATVLKAGLTGAAATMFFMHPISFIAAESVISKFPKLKQKSLKGIDRIAYGEKSKEDADEDEPAGGKFKKEREQLKNAQNQVRQSFKAHADEIEKTVEKIASAKSLQELEFSSQDIQKIERTEKDKDKALNYGKKVKLKALLDSIKKQRDVSLEEGKKIYGSKVSEKSLTGPGSLIYAYNQIMKMIEKKIKELG